MTVETNERRRRDREVCKEKGNGGGKPQPSIPLYPKMTEMQPPPYPTSQMPLMYVKEAVMDMTDRDRRIRRAKAKLEKAFQEGIA